MPCTCGVLHSEQARAEGVTRVTFVHDGRACSDLVDDFAGIQVGIRAVSSMQYCGIGTDGHTSQYSGLPLPLVTGQDCMGCWTGL